MQRVVDCVGLCAVRSRDYCIGCDYYRMAFVQDFFDEEGEEQTWVNCFAVPRS